MVIVDPVEPSPCVLCAAGWRPTRSAIVRASLGSGAGSSGRRRSCAARACRPSIAVMRDPDLARRGAAADRRRGRRRARRRRARGACRAGPSASPPGIGACRAPTRRPPASRRRPKTTDSMPARPRASSPTRVLAHAAGWRAAGRPSRSIGTLPLSCGAHRARPRARRWPSATPPSLGASPGGRPGPRGRRSARPGDRPGSRSIASAKSAGAGERGGAARHVDDGLDRSAAVWPDDQHVVDERVRGHARRLDLDALVASRVANASLVASRQIRDRRPRRRRGP